MGAQTFNQITKAKTGQSVRVCPICPAMDDERRGMDELFSNGKLLPSGHPFCRCAVAYEEIPGTNLNATLTELPPQIEPNGGNEEELTVVSPSTPTPLKEPPVSAPSMQPPAPVLASGENRHSGSGENRQFWSIENRHLQIEQILYTEDIASPR